MKYINRKSHAHLPLTIECYTKATFLDRAWDEQTINARGHVYDEAGNLVSCPFPKIFNIGETPETQRHVVEDLLARHISEVCIYDKYNGHLAILFNYQGEWINTTKGSFDHEFIDDDRKCIANSGLSDDVLDTLPSNWTLLFEIIGEHDPHTMTPVHQNHEGCDNFAVLLGIYDRDTQKMVPAWEDAFESRLDGLVEFPCVARSRDLAEIMPTIAQPVSAYGDVSLDEALGHRRAIISDIIDGMYEERDTEGYVIHIPSIDYRVKVKTHWFLVERYKHQFDNKKTKKIFLRHGSSEQAYEMIPEELHDAYTKVIEDFNEFSNDYQNDLMKFVENLNGLGIHTRKDLAIHLKRPDVFDTREERKAATAYILSQGGFEKAFRELFALLYDQFSLVQSDQIDKEEHIPC